MLEAILFNMFNSVRAKVLVLILAANTLVVLAIYIANQLAFEKSFSEYLQSSTKARLKPVSTKMAQTINQLGTDWIHPGSREFEQIVMIYRTQNQVQSASTVSSERAWRGQRPPRESVRNEGNRPREPRFGGPSNALAEHRPSMHHAERLLFKTPQQTLLLGTARMAEAALWLPIYSGDAEDTTQGKGDLLGFLGVENGSRVSAKFDQLFQQEQQRQFGYIALVVLALSFLLAIPFSKYLVSPILQLRYNARQLASGNYLIKLKPKSKDEIGQLAADMNRLADTLSANRLAQRQWIADISHELRTPIAVLKAELEGMLDGIIDVDETALHSLYEEMTRLTRLVDDLHQLSLADKGALTYTMRPIELQNVLQKVIDKHEVVLKQRAFSIEYLPKSSGNLFGDAERLTQLFDNLMQNTLRYTDSTEAKPGRIEISLFQETDKVNVVWQDSSPGVAPDKVDKLFERLYRVENDRNRKTGGSGLGLAICRAVVSAHQGEIIAKASSLGGVAVHIEFPKE
ncbi:Sensory histidine kinase BaeS [Pseudoalteromonas luteoviolacea B = ATCC 29581]|nr:Sensory histidine kinase BaeS [Pseudoalteromonas luteoviolacea B = ATCC 29581]